VIMAEAETYRVLSTLGAGGKPAIKLATIITELVRHAGQLGELSYQYADENGVLVHGKRFSPRWIERLAKAIETNALDHLTVERIVEIMLQGPR